MKFLHISDLHIGKRVNEVSMIDDQAYILNRILDVVEDTQPDALLICGDIYDKSVPSAEAVSLLDQFLYLLSEKNLDVLIISGNHDSPERLAFGSRLLKNSRIHISPVYAGTVSPVILSDGFGEVCFWMLPFVKPATVKRFFPDQEIITYTDAVSAAINEMKIDPEHRNVLLTHQFVTGSKTCESEEISVGGSDNVDASVFQEFDYVALGHIHGPQNIGCDRIRYCGTPLKYSFSEANHRKSVTLVELRAKGDCQISQIPLHPKRDLREIRGTYLEITAKSYYDNTCTEDYLHIILTDEEDIPEALGRLRVIYPNLLKLSYDNTRTQKNILIDCAEEIQRKSPLQLFGELYEQQNNQPLSEIQKSYLLNLIDSIWEDHA